MINSRECQSCGSENLHLVEYCPTTLNNENWIVPRKFCLDCGQVQGIWKVKLSVFIPPPGTGDYSTEEDDESITIFEIKDVGE